MEDCEHCEGTGVILVADGPDDYRKEKCECRLDGGNDFGYDEIAQKFN